MFLQFTFPLQKPYHFKNMFLTSPNMHLIVFYIVQDKLTSGLYNLQRISKPITIYKGSARFLNSNKEFPSPLNFVLIAMIQDGRMCAHSLTCPWHCRSYGECPATRRCKQTRHLVCLSWNREALVSLQVKVGARHQDIDVFASHLRSNSVSLPHFELFFDMLAAI